MFEAVSIGKIPGSLKS